MVKKDAPTKTPAHYRQYDWHTRLAQEFAADADIELVTLTYKSRCPDITSKKITTRQLDVADEDAVHNTFKHLERLDGVINAVGFLHGEGSSAGKIDQPGQRRNFLQKHGGQYTAHNTFGQTFT